MPVEQDQRQHAPDRQIVKTRIAQHALAQRRAHDLQLLHQQQQDRQRRDRAGHADTEQKLPRRGGLADPSLAPGQQPRRRQAAENQRNAQRQARRDAALAPLHPDLPQIKLDTGNPHKHHHRPPGDAVERLDHRRAEYGGVVIGKRRAKNARAQHDAGDDLHDDQRRVVIGAAQPPDQVRHAEDDRHGDQENIGAVHGLSRLPWLVRYRHDRSGFSCAGWWLRLCRAGTEDHARHQRSLAWLGAGQKHLQQPRLPALIDTSQWSTHTRAAKVDI